MSFIWIITIIFCSLLWDSYFGLSGSYVILTNNEKPFSCHVSIETSDNHVSVRKWRLYEWRHALWVTTVRNKVQDRRSITRDVMHACNGRTTNRRSLGDGMHGCRLVPTMRLVSVYISPYTHVQVGMCVACTNYTYRINTPHAGGIAIARCGEVLPLRVITVNPE